jgi:hypothetical protein
MYININKLTFCLGLLFLSVCGHAGVLEEELKAVAGVGSFFELILTEQGQVDVAELLKNSRITQSFKNVTEIKDSWGLTPLGYACLVKNPAQVEKLLLMGANPNFKFRKKTPLALAVVYSELQEQESLQIIDLLIQHGADVNELADDGKSREMTPLMIAARHGRIEAVRILLKHGAEDRVEGFYSALYFAKGYATTYRDDRVYKFLQNFYSQSKIEGPSYNEANQGRIENQSILENKFTVNRKLSMYKRELGSSFENFMDALTSEDHILDCGSGDTYAMQDYLLESPSFNELTRPMKAWVSAVTFKVRDDRLKSLLQIPKLNLLHGRFFEEIDPQEIVGTNGPLKGIIDYFGVLAYTSQPSLVLKRYFEMLRNDGRVFLMVGSHNPNVCVDLDTCEIGVRYIPGSLYSSSVEILSGEVISFPDWLSRLPGIRVLRHTQYPSHAWTSRLLQKDTLHASEVFEIEISSREAIQIPSLELVTTDMESGAPDRRKFKEVTQIVRIEGSKI